MAEKFSNQHFVEFCKKFIGQPYWYASCVYNCTQSLLDRKSKQYPSHYTSGRISTYKKHIAEKKICADCVGLIKGYAWTNGGEGVFEAIGTGKSIKNTYGSNNCPDKSANGMFSYAKSKGMEWGTIDTIPEIPGIAVRFDGHVGVYIGNGEVVEERGFNYGCVRTKLAGRKWLHWYKLPFINYGEAAITSYKFGERTLVKGMKGEDVSELQTLLTQFGFLKDVIDGDFGSKTEAAVKAFQKMVELDETGIYDKQSHETLMSFAGDNEEDESDDVVEEGIKLEVTGSSVRVRAGDSTSYKSLTIVTKGTKFSPVLGLDGEPLVSKNNWYAILYDEQIAWISGKYIIKAK